LLFANSFWQAQAGSGANGDHASCHMTPAYPPPSNRSLPWFDIDLDVDPHDRWQEVALTFKTQIQNLINFVFHMNTFFSKDLLPIVEMRSSEILARMGSEYGPEIQGLADYTEIEVAKLIIMNNAYELMGLCTSIVAQNTNNTMYHGRNLDFGLYPGINWTDFQWELTEALRPCLFNARMNKGGQLLYSAVFFGGYVGVLTGVRAKAMSITVDSRYDNNYDKYLLDWYTHPDSTLQFLTFTTRNAIENLDNFNDAVNFIMDTPLMCPAFVIIGGPNPTQGAVLTMGPNRTLEDYWDIPHGLPANDTKQAPWYVLETNYDHWENPPKYDDRRYPAEDCMNEIGPKNITIATLYNVLNGKPNRNRLTTYTCIMIPETGHLESYFQYCTDPDCSPW